MNNDVVSIPPNYPTSTTTPRPTHPHQTAKGLKLIYIDPPYNTGHDFIYKDNFGKTVAADKAESGDWDDEGGQLVANPESNGRFHSDWCSMIYPRLLLARDLLTSDGAILSALMIMRPKT